MKKPKTTKTSKTTKHPKTTKTLKTTKHPKTTKRAIILILLTSFCAGSGQLFLKYALSHPFILILYLAEWLFLYLIAITLMTLSFREGELSVLYPFLAISYVWVILVSPIFIVTETLNAAKIVGSIIIFLGVSLIGIGGRK